MTELSRQLLAAAREGLAPDPAIAARVKARVTAAVAGATAVATPSMVATPSAVGSGSLIAKLGAALLIVGIVATTAVVLHERRLDAPRLALTSGDDIDEPRATERIAAQDEAPAREPVHARQVAAVDKAAIEIVEPASLSREVELIDRAMASLRAGSAAAALQSLKTFERETQGQGQMAEEAAAIELESRCVLREDVTARLAAFDRKWPSSAQRVRITTACFAK